MNKKELASGMVVEFERLGYGVIVGQRILFKDSYLCLGDIKDDLTSEHNKALDIVRVYTIKFLVSLSKLENISEDDLVLIWKREREINWKKVTFGTKVIASDYEEDIYEVDECNVTHFINYDERIKAYPFMTVDNPECNDVVSYKYCRIHPDVEIKEEWYK